MSLRSLEARLAKIPEPDLERYKAQERYEKLKQLSTDELHAFRNFLRRDRDWNVKLTSAAFAAAIKEELVALGLPPRPIERIFAPHVDKTKEQQKSDKATSLKTPPGEPKGKDRPTVARPLTEQPSPAELRATQRGTNDRSKTAKTTPSQRRS